MKTNFTFIQVYLVILINIVICITKVLTCPILCTCEQEYYVYCDNRTIKNEQLSSVTMSMIKTTMYIDLSHNLLTNLPRSIFSQHTDLLDLDLGHNHIKQISPSAFGALSNLQRLDLRGNSLLELQEGIFSGLSEVRQLYLQMNDIQTIHDPVFLNLTNLQELHLHGNKLQEISHGLFSSLHNLHTLDLSHNAIVTVENNAFSNLVSLRKLSLSNNQITEVLAQMFSGLSSLRELNLNKNKIRQLHKYHLDPFRGQIIQLRLAFNQIKQIDGDLLRNMNNLQILDFSNNQIYAISDEAFTGIKLEELSLSRNQIKEIWRTSFSGARRIKILNLKDNEIEQISTGAFDSFRESIYILNLSGNKLGNFRYGMVRGMKYLQVLDISASDISSIDNSALSDLKNLQEANLSENQLVSMHSGMLKGLSAISRLYLHCNPMKSFLGFKFSSQIYVSLNLTLLSVSYDSFHVTWPYKDGSQSYWSLSVTCLNGKKCHFSEKPEYLPPYKTDIVVKELSPLSHYYVCVNPSFLSSDILVEQCLFITTPEMTYPVTQKPPVTEFSSTSSAERSQMSHNALFSFVILFTLIKTMDFLSHYDLLISARV